MGDRLDFSVGTEIDLVFARGVDIDLFFVCGPKITCFEYRDRLTCFCVGGRKWLGFLVRSEILGFSGGIEIYLVFVWVVEIHLNTVCKIEIDLIPV